MCESFDATWKFVLGFLLLLSIVTMLLRVKYSSAGQTSPQWLAGLLFWGSGFVGVSILALMVLGFACAGSPGDIDGIIPN